MPMKRSTPGTGVVRKHEQFSYTRTPAGLKGQWYGWCAAEPYWCKAHEHTDKTPGTKICCTWFTDGAVPCPRCRPAVVPTDIAYVFVWREEDHAPCLVICHESAAEFLTGLEFGVYVYVGCAERGAGVYVKRAAEQRTWKDSLPYRQGPVDIAMSLLTIWDYPAVNQWYAMSERRARQQPSEAADKVPAPVKLRLSVPPPTTEVEALAIDAEKKAEKYDLRALVNGIGKVPPSTNGKHKPPNTE